MVIHLVIEALVTFFTLARYDETYILFELKNILLS